MSLFIYKIIWNSRTRDLVLWLLFSFYKIRKGRITCVCWGGTNYNCNPRAITEKMVELDLASKEVKNPFEIAYAFVNTERFAEKLPKELHAVEIGSLKYFYLLATSQFIISNTRFGGGMYWPFKKKKGQYYIQTMHGGHGMKKQELEVSDTLGEAYIKALYEDASRIDLMISDSSFWTEKARTIFAYPEGEILEKGLPRNDIFFAPQGKKDLIKAEICKKLNIVSDNLHNIHFAVYCPTFRANGRRDVYGFNPDSIVKAFEDRFGDEWYILVSSHPNMQSYYKSIYDFSHDRMKDVGQEDLQPILVSSDAAITDYSSAGFEFALSNNPCFLLCRDLEDYDRGVYFDMKKLPFPYAENDDELIGNILNFDREKYLTDLEKFNREVIGLKETGHAAEAVVEWMMARMS